MYSFHETSSAISSCIWFFIYLSPFHFVLLYRQNILLPRKFFFHIYILNLHAYSISLAHSYSTNCATLRYGGILTNIWISSGHACILMISTFFSSHHFLIIYPNLLFIFLLYFGANTMWYWRLNVPKRTRKSWIYRPHEKDACGARITSYTSRRESGKQLPVATDAYIVFTYVGKATAIK